MQWTPLPLANLLLVELGTAARPAALLGALAVAMLAGGIAGVPAATAGRDLVRTIIGFLLSGGVLLVVLVALGADSLSTLAFVAVYLTELTLFNASALSRPGRRDFLVRTAIVLGGAAVLSVLYPLSAALRPSPVRRFFAFRPPRGWPVAGLTPAVTSDAAFYRMDKVIQAPALDATRWRLRVGGAVRSPFTLDYAGLLRRPRVDRYATLECVDNPVGGPLMGNALWSGCPLASLIDDAGALGDVVVLHGADGETESVPLHRIRGTGALLVYGMNGATLSRQRGYPARAIMPGLYGFKSIKWLTGIEVARRSQPGIWRSHGWTEEGLIRTTTRIDVARRTGDAVFLAGVAFAGTRGISSVEARANAGPWRRATLGAALSDDTWVQWGIRLRATGPARIEVRAVDGSGVVQTGSVHGPYPDGATGWPAVTV